MEHPIFAPFWVLSKFSYPTYLLLNNLYFNVSRTECFKSTNWLSSDVWTRKYSCWTCNQEKWPVFEAFILIIGIGKWRRAREGGSAGNLSCKSVAKPNIQYNTLKVLNTLVQWIFLVVKSPFYAHWMLYDFLFIVRTPESALLSYCCRIRFYFEQTRKSSEIRDIRDI